ncbi:MAG: hypothetical protein MOGMAGMI_01328 [Candidatus Omnitrophica bacterium]|nr:hypothetical protein [Candidatus Omnitrophota bacterium]
MSLRIVHIFFIVCALVLSIGYAVWSLQTPGVKDQPLHSGLGWLSLAVAVALVVYLKWFVSKQKGLTR